MSRAKLHITTSTPAVVVGETSSRFRIFDLFAGSEREVVTWSCCVSSFHHIVLGACVSATIGISIDVATLEFVLFFMSLFRSCGCFRVGLVLEYFFVTRCGSQ